MMNKIFYGALFPLVFLLVFLSCTARINGSLLGDGQANLQIYAALEPRMTMLLSGLAAASGTMQQGAPLLNGPAIATSMAAAPGVASVSFQNTSPVSIEGSVAISKVGDFLSPGTVAGKPQNFIAFFLNPPAVGSTTASGGRCSVNLSLNTGPEILALISPDIGAYLAALMAPLATGEALKKTEYVALVTSVYGKGIADEISQASIRASIEFPGPVLSARGGTFSGRRAEFTIPLLDVLVLETPLRYEVIWR
jgi:hypothetical protein